MATKPMPVSEPTIEEATAEAEEAAALVNALEERIRSGDASVTAVDLANARGLAEFASLQRDAAERRAQRVNVQLTADEVAAVVGAAQALATERRAATEKLEKAAQRAFSAYMDAVDRDAYDASQILSRLRAVNVRAQSLDVEPTGAAGVREASGCLVVSTRGGTHAFPPDRPSGGEPLATIAAAASIELNGTGGSYSGGISITRKRPWPPKGR